MIEKFRKGQGKVELMIIDSETGKSSGVLPAVSVLTTDESIHAYITKVEGRKDYLMISSDDALVSKKTNRRVVLHGPNYETTIRAYHPESENGSFLRDIYQAAHGGGKYEN